MTAGPAAPQAARYRKRPVEVEAVQWTGDNIDAMLEFTGCDKFDLLDEQQRRDGDDPDATAAVFDKLHSTWILVYDGDWVIKGTSGELWPNRPDKFAEGYEPVSGGGPGQAGTPGRASFIARNMALAPDGGGPDWLACLEHLWDGMTPDGQDAEEAGAQAAIRAGGWDALTADIEALAPGDGVSVGSTILAQVCRAVTARLTGSKPQGEVSVWIDDEGDGDAKVTVAWGAPREAERAARGE